MQFWNSSLWNSSTSDFFFPYLELEYNKLEFLAGKFFLNGTRKGLKFKSLGHIIGVILC